MSNETILVQTENEWGALDLNCDGEIGLDRAVMDITCLNGFISDGSIGINIPMNRNNNKVLTWPARLGVCDSPLVGGALRACYQCGGITYLDGLMTMNEASAKFDHSCASINVNIIGGQRWRDELEDCTFADIDAGSHVYNNTNISLSWDRANQDNFGVSYYPVSYGDLDGAGKVIPDQYEELRPNVYFDNILNGIFELTSYTLDPNCPFLNSEPWRGMTWIYSGFSFGLDPDLIPLGTVSALTGLQVTGDVTSPVFQSVASDPGQNMVNGVFTAPFTTTYDIVGEIRIDLGAANLPAFVTRTKNGSVDTQYAPFPIFAPGFYTIDIDSNECLTAGETISWLISTADGQAIAQGGEVTITPTVTPCVNATIQNAGLLPQEIECNDFLDAIRIMFGLVFVTNEQTKQVCLSPINDYFNELDVEDWTDKVDFCQLATHRFLFGDIPRCHKFLWTKDDLDGYVDELERISNIAEGEYWSEERCLSKNYQGEKEHKPLFSPTVQYNLFNGNDITSLPQLWTDFELVTPPEVSYDFGNHFAYFAGLNPTNPNGRNFVWNAPDGSTDLPYAYQQSFLGGNEQNFAFNDQGTQFPGLVTTYYSFIFDALISGRIVEAAGVITKKDWLTLDFSKIKVIGNNHFVLLEVQGWNPKDGQAKLILLHLC